MVKPVPPTECAGGDEEDLQGEVGVELGGEEQPAEEGAADDAGPPGVDGGAGGEGDRDQVDGVGDERQPRRILDQLAECFC